MADVLKMLRDNIDKSSQERKSVMPETKPKESNHQAEIDLANEKRRNAEEKLAKANEEILRLNTELMKMQDDATKQTRTIAGLREDIKDLGIAGENRQSIDKQRIVDLQVEVEKLKARLEFASKSEPSVQVVKQNFEIPEFDVVPERGHDGKIIRAKLKPVGIEK